MYQEHIHVMINIIQIPNVFCVSRRVKSYTYTYYIIILNHTHIVKLITDLRIYVSFLTLILPELIFSTFSLTIRHMDALITIERHNYYQ